MANPPSANSLTPARIAQLLAPFLPAEPVAESLFAQLATYLDLLLLWNGRTNLTSVRDPEHIVTRHFGESLFCARLIPPATRTLLDLGSGAGFPGLPIQLLRPDLSITLAESQGKKAAFLREVVRTLGLPTQVHAARAETLTSTFDVVTLRAVDNMSAALAAASRLSTGAILALVGRDDLAQQPPTSVISSAQLPGSQNRLATLLAAQ